MMTLRDLIDNQKLSMAFKRVDSNPAMEKDAHMTRHFKITLKNNLSGNKMTLFYSQGSALTTDPTMEDILDCLASDASSVENSKSFEEWARDLGYDDDSRRAEKTYREIKKQIDDLRSLMGADYKTLLWDVERL